MIDQQKQIEALHQSYCSLSGQKVPLTIPRSMAWEEFIVAMRDYEATPMEAVRIVFTHRQKEVKAGRRQFLCLLFKFSIQQADDFGEELAGLLALRRKPCVSPGKAKVLRASGRSADLATGEPQSAAQVLEHEKMAEMLKQWRMENA